MTKLTKSEVEHIGKLANLDLTESELEKFGGDLSKILDFVGNLSSVDTEQISPLSNVTGKKNVFREDKVGASLSQKEALANAPVTHNGFFKIKAIFER